MTKALNINTLKRGAQPMALNSKSYHKKHTILKKIMNIPMKQIEFNNDTVNVKKQNIKNTVTQFA